MKKVILIISLVKLIFKILGTISQKTILNCLKTLLKEVLERILLTVVYLVI